MQKNKILIISAVLVLFASVFIFNMQVEAQSKTIKGKIVNFSSLVTGDSGEVDKERAEKLIAAGHQLVLKSGNTIYFIVNQDGTSANKKIANYVNAKEVAVHGKVSKKMGLNVIILELIDSVS